VEHQTPCGDDDNDVADKTPEATILQQQQRQ
jgi:hypothetical protein